MSIIDLVYFVAIVTVLSLVSGALFTLWVFWFSRGFDKK
jgi:hypothetical protein